MDIVIFCPGNQTLFSRNYHSQGGQARYGCRIPACPVLSQPAGESPVLREQGDTPYLSFRQNGLKNGQMRAKSIRISDVSLIQEDPFPFGMGPSGCRERPLPQLILPGQSGIMRDHCKRREPDLSC